MRISPCLLAGTLAFVFLAAGVRPASACSCVGTPSPCQAFATSPIVFVGEVLSTTTLGEEFRMRLRVVRALKGITETTADLWSSATSSCGIRLGEGKRYVVYTSRSNGRMSIHACGYFHELVPGEPEPELPPLAGRVYGRVSRYDIDRIRHFQRLEGIPSVRIALDLPAGRITATTDRSGRFQFARVPAGEYALSADAGPGLTVWTPRTIAISTSEACIDANVVLQPAGKVSGRLVTADGRPAAGIYVRLLPDGPAGSRLAQLVDRGKTTGPAGTFAFAGLGPDNYVVAVNPDAGDPSGRQPYPPVWFGGTSRATAKRIRLAEGGAVELERPFVLPPPLPTRTFTITASCRDGSVPPALMVRAMAVGGATFAEFEELAKGEVHTLTIMRDRAYTLLVSIFVPVDSGQGTRREQALAPMALAAGSPGRHIAMVAPIANCGERAR